MARREHPLSRDELFYRVIVALISVMGLYGLGMTVVILLGDHALGSRMISGFSTMFAGVLGFGGGYLLGQTTSANSDDRRPPSQ